jgi:Transglycosylase
VLKRWVRRLAAFALAASLFVGVASELWYRSLLPDDLPAAPPPPVSARAREIVWQDCRTPGPPRLERSWPPFFVGTLAQRTVEGLREPRLERHENRSCLVGQAARLLDRRPPRRTPRYLIDQLALATWVERNWTAEQALDFVAANVWMGEGARGVEVASASLFGRPMEALTIAEAALLVGIVRSPHGNDPRCRPDHARDARDAVLDRLLENAQITPREREEAVATPLTVLGDCPSRPSVPDRS